MSIRDDLMKKKKSTGRKLQTYIATVSAKTKVKGSAKLAKLKRKARKKGLTVKVSKVK